MDSKEEKGLKSVRNFGIFLVIMAFLLFVIEEDSAGAMAIFMASATYLIYNNHPSVKPDKKKYTSDEISRIIIVIFILQTATLSRMDDSSTTMFSFILTVVLCIAHIYECIKKLKNK